MTLEEAIKLLKQYQGYEPMFPDGEKLKHAFDLTDETVDTLLSALRGPTRGMVERMRGEWQSIHGLSEYKMDYDKLIERLKAKDFERDYDCTPFECGVFGLLEDTATAITDLLARAEAAEERCKRLDEARENANEAAAKWEGMYHMAEARAEKAERERDELFRILNDVCQDVRAKSADEYVCGLCEYDGAHIGESGDWVNECPGFEKDDCFCIKKSMREEFGQKEE